MRISKAIASGLLLAGLGVSSLAAYAATSQTIQMLPPAIEGSTPTSTTVCSSTTHNLLTWDATNPILCAVGVTAYGGNLATTGTLSVGSTSTFSGTMTISSGNIAVSGGTVTANAYYHNSDQRLKTDIRPIGNALDKILALKGVQFNWKKDGRADMGVVAQNVLEVFPDVVTKNSNGMMSVEYDSLVGPMIEAIRQLKTENDDLRKKVAGMEDMKAQLTQIRASLQNLQHDQTQLHAIKLEDKQVAKSQMQIDN